MPNARPDLRGEVSQQENPGDGGPVRAQEPALFARVERSSASARNAVSDQPRDDELPINLEKVCYIVVRARQFDVKEEVVEADYGGNQADEGFRQVLEDYG